MHNVQLHPQPPAFLLLSLRNATLRAPYQTFKGCLNLEYVAAPPLHEFKERNVLGGEDRGVYLVLRIGDFETPIDAARVIDIETATRDRIKANHGPSQRTYTFHGTPFDPVDLKLDVSSEDAETLDTFDGILAQYAQLRRASASTINSEALPSDHLFISSERDLRGQLVLVDEASGEVVGAFDDWLAITEATSVGKEAEQGPVVIEIPESELDGSAFVRPVLQEESDWILKSATMASYAITSTANLLVTSLTAASSYYMAHSAPSPYHPSSKSSLALPPSHPTFLPASSSSTSFTSPTLPLRAVQILNSLDTRTHLSRVHALSGHVVQVSKQTVGVINDIIGRAVGATVPTVSNAASGEGLTHPLPPRSPSPSLPPYSVPAGQGASSALCLGFAEKPALPLRLSSALARKDQSTKGGTAASGEGKEVTMSKEKGKLSTKDRLLLSANLILTSFDDATTKVIDASGENLGAVMEHKYGPEAKQNTLLMTGTARNLALVYIDMRGIGRRALLKRAGKEFVKGRASAQKNQRM